MPEHDFPFDPEEVTDSGVWREFTKEVDGTTIDARIRVQRDGKYLRYEYEVGSVESTTPRLRDHGHDGRVIGWNGERELADDVEAEGVILPEEVDREISRQEDEFNAEITAQTDDFDRAMNAAPVIFAVYKMQYTATANDWGSTLRTAWVLKPMVKYRDLNSEADRERFLNDEQQDVFAALTDVLGETKGFPSADGDDNPFTHEDHGAEFTVDEVAERVDGFENGLQASKHRRESDEAWDELVGEFPILNEVSTDAETVRDALDEADDRDVPVEITTESDRCNDQSRDCSLDRVSYSATPDGEITARRTHTH